MRPVPLRFSTTPSSGQLADLLTDWLRRTPYGPTLQGVRVPSDGEEALATLEQEDRSFQVRLHPGGPPGLWLLEASTRIHPQEPNRGWSLLAGAVMALLGIVLSLRWLSFGAAPFLIGLGISLGIGGLVAGMTQSRALDRRSTAATRQGGGQGPAEALLAQLTEVIGADSRVRLA